MPVQAIPQQPDTVCPQVVPGGIRAEGKLESYKVFNQRHVVTEGWYWLLQSRQIEKGKVKAVSILGQALAVYRTENNNVYALDAHCPHMGAHLAEGKVEGEELRCFFHNWRYNSEGNCTDIPCLNESQRPKVSTRSWHVAEKHGLVWIWMGAGKPSIQVPEIPELAGTEYDHSIGKPLFKHCHPNVVMINAIDEQHFQTVHALPGHILSLRAETKNEDQIEFRNQGSVPTTSLFGKFVALFYRKKLTYDLCYWYGSVGTLALGPDFLHLYIMFSLRLTKEGYTEGQMVVFTPKRKGPHGWLFNRVILQLTKIASSYFASGDTRIFQTIRFQLKTPTIADRSLIAFINHLEQHARLIPAFTS